MMAFFFSILNAANPAQAAMPTGSSNVLQMVSQFLPFLLIIVIFYFFLIRPQTKQKQALAQMIQNLKIGDKVITKGGIIGKIDKIEENNLIIELYDGSKIEILKHAVISILNEAK